MSKNLRKKDFRCKAHVGSFKTTNLDIPNNPNDVDWAQYFKNGQPPSYLDIGCGYGRFLFQAGQVCKNKNILGVEVREKVYRYVKLYIEKRQEEYAEQQAEMGSTVDNLQCDWSNMGVINTNALLFLVNIVKPKSIEKMFILFPDPHFKASKQKGRMVCKQQMQVFKYILADHGEIFISTDVKELFESMCQVFDQSGLFEIKQDAVNSNFSTLKIPISERIEKLNSSGKKSEEDIERFLFDISYMDTDEAHRAGIKSGHTFGRIYKLK